MSDMRITFKTFDEILPLKDLQKSRHQRNKHPKDQIERLAKIMKVHGVRHPIHVSALSGEVCFGHGRWEAAKANGWKEFPVVYQEFKDDQEEYACVQSDNAIAHWSELDLPSIKQDLLNFDKFDPDLLGIKSLDKIKDKFEFKPLEITQQFNLLIECSNEVDQQALFEELDKRGLLVKIL